MTPYTASNSLPIGLLFLAPAVERRTRLPNFQRNLIVAPGVPATNTHAFKGAHDYKDTEHGDWNREVV